MDLVSGGDSDGRWVFLDAVGTLIHPVPSVAGIYAEVAAKHGSRRTAVEIDEEFDAVYLELTRHEPQTDEAAEREFWRQAVGRLIPDADDPDGCFAEIFERFARPDAWSVFEDVERGFRKLRDGNYRIAIASNFDARLRTVAAGLTPLCSADALVISTEIGWKKPARQFWDAALQMTGANPARSASIGDSFHEDVKAARQAGMKGFWLKRGEQRRPAAVRTFDEAVERLVAARPPG